MQIVASILWQRLDVPGHDACRLEHSDAAWQLDGAAVFRQADGQIAQLHYRVRCDSAWHTQWGTVRGWIGNRAVDLSAVHDAKGRWTLNDTPVADLAHCVDLDLGFTPATNLIALRRMHLQPGEQSAAPAAFFDVQPGGRCSGLLAGLQVHSSQRDQVGGGRE
ncbi:MAG: hypothetical protein EOO24_59045, partial [Comamonadaceae bacterium]